MTFYGDCMKRCEDFVANFGDKRTGFGSRQLTVLDFLTSGFFYQKTKHDCHPQQPHLPDLGPCDFSVFLIEDKTEEPPF
jgi:hypothetical protein